MRRLSRNDLEAIADRVVTAYTKLPEIASDEVFRIDPEVLCCDLLNLKLDYRCLSTDRSILGLTSFESTGITLYDDGGNEEVYLLDGKTVLIENELREDVTQLGRRNFTIIHEASHQVLKMMFPMDYGRRPHEDKPVQIHCYRAETGYRGRIRDWEEWQTNALASAILLPQSLVERAMYLFGINGKIRVLNKLFARDDYERFVGMTELLGCSKTALAIRMTQLGYIGENYLDNPYRMLDVEVD